MRGRSVILKMAGNQPEVPKRADGSARGLKAVALSAVAALDNPKTKGSYAGMI